jgi:hypothetical protein
VVKKLAQAKKMKVKRAMVDLPLVFGNPEHFKSNFKFIGESLKGVTFHLGGPLYAVQANFADKEAKSGYRGGYPRELTIPKGSSDLKKVVFEFSSELMFLRSAVFYDSKNKVIS